LCSGFQAIRILLIVIIGFFCATTWVLAEKPAKTPAEKEEKSELAKIMEKVDKNYKAVEQLSGHFMYNEKQWKIIEEAGADLVRLSKIVIKRFPRRDDEKYQRLNKIMLEESEKLYDIATNHKNEEGALEDAQWQVRKLRQTCALCHKHLDIHLYPQLYPGHKKK